MENITCQHCGAKDEFYLVESGPHVKANCSRCNKYIKFISQDKPPFTKDTIMPFGKHKGQRLSTIPPDYLLWCHDQPKCHKQLKAYIDANITEIHNILYQRQ